MDITLGFGPRILGSSPGEGAARQAGDQEVRGSNPLWGTVLAGGDNHDRLRTGCWGFESLREHTIFVKILEFIDAENFVTKISARHSFSAGGLRKERCQCNFTGPVV